MRIWSIHPKYLDAKGLVALWRETLLAKHVLEGKTKGYRHHPQLDRFKKSDMPLDLINEYLSHVYYEAVSRHYNFAKDKINWNFKSSLINVTSGQIKYEINHLMDKLKLRDPLRYKSLLNEKSFLAHPVFNIVEGDIEDWEIQ